ncbi:MAG: hybrid sensor histidine kinase/response regulator [Deltaproteobacteria bacterium]|nr:MAG: hybrid sensor histidine kinase/response regulator [Deltaproteobacteria bacterium]
MTQGYHKISAENNLPGSGPLSAPDKSDSDKIVSGQTSPASFDTVELSFEQLKVVLESSPAGFGVVTDRVLGWANESFYEMLGYEVGSLGGKNVRILYPTQREYERVGKLLALGMEKYDVGMVETRLSRKDGTVFDCRIRASLLYPGDPEKGKVVVVTDISELKSLQIQLQQAQKMEAIGVLAGGISHDFNNILMGIQGHLSLMQIDMTAVEKMASHTRQIKKLVDTAAELTGRLLGFARGGKYQIAILDANQVVKMALGIFTPSLKNIIVHESFEEKLHLVDGDHSQLEQVCLNLLINASQAMMDTGDIFISTQNIFITEDHGYPFAVLPGRYIKLSIKDTGIGMDTKIQKKIFDPFFSTKGIGDKKGRGLGLSTVFGIVKNHGGFITVRSKKGKGSEFMVFLPASNEVDIKDLPEETSSLDQMLKGSETVLLVDDEQEILNVGKNFLEKLGYTPLIAQNGLEAVEMFKAHKDQISLVVLDLIMPVMDGKQAFAHIKAIKNDTKFIMTTGYTVDEKLEDILHQGYHGFIQKPFSLHEFSRVIRTILDKRNP